MLIKSQCWRQKIDWDIAVDGWFLDQNFPFSLPFSFISATCVHLTLRHHFPPAFSHWSLPAGASITNPLLLPWSGGASLQRAQIHLGWWPGEGSTGTLWFKICSSEWRRESTQGWRQRQSKSLSVRFLWILIQFYCDQSGACFTSTYKQFNYDTRIMIQIQS